MNAPSEGWSRFVVKSKFGMGKDFEVQDIEGRRAFVIDGKVGPRPKAEVQDSSGSTLYTVRGKLLGIPKHMSIADSAKREVASLKAKHFSPIKSRMTLELADGGELSVEGEITEKEYTISTGGQPVAAITEKWVTVRDTYTVDVRDGVDPGLVLAALWAIDRWVEHD